MAKAQEKSIQVKNMTEMKDKKSKDKDRKGKDEDALVGRVKKVIKKSRRKLSEEKFEKQLQRTIAFLEELQAKLTESRPAVIDLEKGKKVKTNNRTRDKVKELKQDGLRKKNKTPAASVKQAVATTAKTVNSKRRS
jgi:hypothetical protein